MSSTWPRCGWYATTLKALCIDKCVMAFYYATVPISPIFRVTKLVRYPPTVIWMTTLDTSCQHISPNISLITVSLTPVLEMIVMPCTSHLLHVELELLSKTSLLSH